MKYLSEYMEKRQTDLFKKTGAFFAFSTDQFNEQKKEGVKYINCGAGLICEYDNYKELAAGIVAISAAARAQDIKENGIDGIIIRELHNHEAFYTMDIYDTFQTVKQYGISEIEVRTLFNMELDKIDWNNY